MASRPPTALRWIAKPILLLLALAAMMLDSVFGEQGMLFYAASGLPFGLGLDWLAERLEPRNESIANHVWVIPLLILAVSFFLRVPEVAVSAFVALAASRAALFVRLSHRAEMSR